MQANVSRGFEGSVTASSVADVLQLQGGNRFSGSIVFTYEGQEAAVYMQHGEVVHAEYGDLRGEAVLGAILAWPSGAFQAHANVATFARTIDKRLEHLLLDSARQLDETRRSTPPPMTATPPARPGSPLPSQPPPRPSGGATERVRAVAGVTGAVVLRGGAPVGDTTPEAVALASRATFLLSMLANPLGKALGLGDVTRAGLSAADGQLLLLQAKEAYLAVTVEAQAPLGEVEAEIRKAVNARQVS